MWGGEGRGSGGEGVRAGLVKFASDLGIRGGQWNMRLMQDESDVIT